MDRDILLVALLGAGIAGCTQMNLQGEQQPDDRVFTTGSHLPSKSASSNSVTVLQAPTPDQAARGAPCVGGMCGASK